jgi:MFS family permease
VRDPAERTVRDPAERAEPTVRDPAERAEPTGAKPGGVAGRVGARRVASWDDGRSPERALPPDPPSDPLVRQDALAALRIPVVRAFVIGRIAAVVGFQALTIAVGWHLYERTGSAWSLGLVGLFELAPVLLLMLPAGHMADRFPRRNVAMFAHSLLALAAIGLAFVSANDGPVAVIYALLVLVGTARAFASPSVATLLPQLLRPEQFANVNAWLSTSFELASISGPALGGWLIALGGSATGAFIAAAAGQLLFVVLLLRLPALAPTRRTTTGARDLFAGFGFIRRHPVFLAAITLDLFAVLFGGAIALLPVFAKDILHVGPVGLGWLRAAPSLGAMSMAALTTLLPSWQRPGRVLLIVVVGFGLATVGFGLSRTMWLSLLCLFLTGVFDAISVVIRLTLEQVLTPDALRGRVSSIHYVFIGFSNELGAFESGAAAALLGPVVAVAGGGVVAILVVGAVAVLWPELTRLGPLHSLRPYES